MELFEVSWEVCNKVGGIYTVISSKAKIMKNYVKQHYYVGPYLHENQTRFEEKPVPKKFQKAFEKLALEGIHCHYGKWETYGNAILIDFSGLIEKKNEIKAKLWEDFKIDSLFSSWEFDEPIIWSTAVGKLIQAYGKTDVVVHCHEWMAGGALLYQKQVNCPCKKVFTTHATMLGRTISSNYRNLYKEIESLDPMAEAKRYNILEKHTAEKACAEVADVFTTVSSITAFECEHLLGKKPDILLPNGLDQSNFKGKPSSKVDSIIKKNFPNFFNYTILFTSGRYEFKDKGMDVFIDALARLKTKKPVVALFLVPRDHYGVKEEFGKEVLDCTHNIQDPENDFILRSFKEHGLDNSENIKVLFIPVYISKYDDFMKCKYYNFISGCDMGVFPSMYEPWGYTPLECAELGIPSVTTNLAGFGMFINRYLTHTDHDGVFILDRQGKEDVVEDLARTLDIFIEKSKSDREKNNISAKALSSRADWKILIKNYLKAYDL